MLTKKYNLVNNVTGWVVFVIALVTYWLTLEPTASYWDCGEFIIQADKLEVGHPPGNPIFMLTARFFANFAPDASKVSVMVNAMSGLLSALTILLLFWSITHLVRRLIVRDGFGTGLNGSALDSKKGSSTSDPCNSGAKDLSLSKYLVIMGSGLVGALAYTWSDTFWFSAVEGEVYAFSSFCTALVFWLILKWEDRADMPHSDKYLVLIAYVIGVSIAVHLLNLLCIPAIVLVFAYRKFKDMNVKKSLLALLVSFVIIVLVLFGLVPGFIKMAQQFELLFVNGFHLSYNSGALAYAIVAAGLFIWALYELRRQHDARLIKISFFLAITVSGMLFIGSGWWLGVILTILFALWLCMACNPIPVRVLNVAMWSVAVIFVGYSSYALILIRSSADTPMNQNAPDNVFDLATYLSREQYGETPLIYGETLYSSPAKKLLGVQTDTLQYGENGEPIVLTYPVYDQIIEKGKPIYVKGVKGAVTKSEYNFLSPSELADNAKLADRGGDYYVLKDYKSEMKTNPELKMLFPRIYSRMHKDLYSNWVRLDTTPANMKELWAVDERTGEKVAEQDLNGQPFMNPITGAVSFPQKMGYRPTFSQNLSYFFNYQLFHMYMRYFMWNFAGRQNDILNQYGELDAGNWISGIPFIDNARLGDQSYLPDDLGKNNQGHNVYYMLPLILGLIGLLWQAFVSERGVEQFWVVFFLFFMTGIAIVLYLNQPPGQPRERDYAFAGSFYAYAIWIGLGVAGLWQLLDKVIKKEKVAAIVACVLGLAVPLQMVSQTWDDHDRSGRYAARDFAINYLESLEPNAIVFCNGDNDTFPLWYVQEVEGVRPDVKIVNLSYLASDWYAGQQMKKSYDAPAIDMTATPADIAYSKLDVTVLGSERAPMDLMSGLKALYSGQTFNAGYGYPELPSSVVTIPVDKKAVIARGLVAAKDSDRIVDKIVIDLGAAESVRRKGYVSLSELLMLDIIATNAAEGWPRPIYWCSSVGNEYHTGLTDYLMSTGMTHQLLPTRQEGLPARTDRAYDVVTKKYQWGGADKATKDWHPYFDETARRMLVATRNSMMDVAERLIIEGDDMRKAGDEKGAREAYGKARNTLELLTKNLSENTARYGVTAAVSIPDYYGMLGERLGDKKLTAKALEISLSQVDRLMQYVTYSRRMVMEFGNNPSTTIESRYMPYQIYRLVEIYQDYGGDMTKLDAILKKHGATRDELKRYYDMANGVSNETTTLSAEDYAKELESLSELINELAAMSPEEYAQQSDEDKLYDSLFYGAWQKYQEAGVSPEMMKKYQSFQQVDMARSKRLYEESSIKM